MPEVRRLGPVPRIFAALLALLGVVAGVSIVLTARHTSELAADVKARELAARAVPNLGVTLRNALTAAETSRGVNAQRVPFERRKDLGIPTSVAVRARDTGRALLSDNGTVVAATYSTPEAPKNVVARRASITGLYVVPLQLGPAVTQLQPVEGGISVTSPGRTLGEAGGPAPSGASTYSVPLALSLASGWTVDVWAPRHGIGFVAWLLAALCVLGGVGLAGFVLRRSRDVVMTENELGALQQQSEVLANLAGVAQRSLDLADVLPAVTTQLSDALGLRGVSLTAQTRDGGERAFFRHGEVPSPRPLSVLPPTIGAGESVSILLARGNRTVARLNVLTGRRLDARDIVTLEAAGEILTSALTNAEAFAQQREVLQRLRAVDELKTVFLATASHELRTPVGVISGFAELLATHVENLQPDKIRDYATRIDATAQQLASLVENLLDFSRMERGVLGRQEQEDVDLGECVESILEEHQDLSSHHEVLPSSEPGLVVRGSEHAVERVLTNLVGNAAKYSPAGTTIRVIVREEGGKAVIHVDDEGPGVAPGDREQVFSRFYRGSGDAVVNTRGAGLGLAIVHEFAASMGGVASVTESPSGGARFTVRFPLADRPDTSLPTSRALSEGTTDVLT